MQFIGMSGGAVAWLQWGRDQLVAEIVSSTYGPVTGLPASMGPRPIGRGNPAGLLGPAAAEIALQWGRDQLVAEIPDGLQHSARHAAELQWGRDQLVAEMFRVFRKNANCIRFNGAATNWSRKCDGAIGRRSGEKQASMGPRPIGRGNGRSRVRRLVRRGASMGPRPIGRGNSSAPGSPAPEAPQASMGPRPIGRGNQEITMHTHTPETASMGPRPIGRGNLGIRVITDGSDVGFNGAATNWSRKSHYFFSPFIFIVCFNGAATNWSRKFWYN